MVIEILAIDDRLIYNDDDDDDDDDDDEYSNNWCIISVCV